jgi:hypothetical protein
MKSKLNPELKVGDRIMCFHMEGETSVPPGTLGTVTKITRDPFESKNENLISVKWDNGSNLSLITSTDAWKLVPKENIKEQIDDTWRYMTDNPDVFEHFDWRFFRDFLEKIRKSGIVNMFEASPLIYSGKEHIDRYYGEGNEDDEDYINMLEDADESKNKLIQGVVSYMEANNKGLDDMSLVNRYAKNFSQKILGLFMTMHGLTNNR